MYQQWLFKENNSKSGFGSIRTIFYMLISEPTNDFVLKFSVKQLLYDVSFIKENPLTKYLRYWWLKKLLESRITRRPRCSDLSDQESKFSSRKHEPTFFYNKMHSYKALSPTTQFCRFSRRNWYGKTYDHGITFTFCLKNPIKLHTNSQLNAHATLNKIWF